MPVVPMFHVNAWGLPFAAPAVGDVLAVGLSGAYGATSSPQGFISQPPVREMVWNGRDLIDQTPVWGVP